MLEYGRGFGAEGEILGDEKNYTNEDHVENEKSGRHQHQLSVIGSIATSYVGLNTAFPEFADRVNKLIPFDRLVLSIINPETQQIINAYEAGVTSSTLIQSDSYSLEESELLARVHQELEVVVVDGGTAKEQIAADCAESNSRTIAADLKLVMFVPIVHRAKLIGSLAFRSKLENPYGQNEIELAGKIAAQIVGIVSDGQQIELLKRSSQRDQRLISEQTRIKAIGKIAGSTSDFINILSQFGEQVKHLVPNDRMVISSWSEDGTVLTDRYVVGIDIPGHQIGKELIVVQDEVWNRLYKEKLPWVVNGRAYESHKERNNRERARYKSGLRALLIVPLLWQGINSGSIAFRSKNPDAFDEHQVDLAVDVAAQIAGAVASANQIRLLERQSLKMERLAFEQTLIAEIGKLSGSTLEFEDVFESFVNRAKQLIPLDRIVVSINSTDGQTATDMFVHGTETLDTRLGDSYPIDEGFKRIASKMSAFNASLNDLEEMAKTSPSEQVRLDAGYRSLMMTPMIAQGQSVGRLIFRSKELDAYSDHHIELAKQISDQIGGAVAGSLQFSQLQAESAERARLADERRRIAELGRIVSSTLDLDEVYSSFAEQAKALVPSDRFVIMIVSEDRKSTIDAFIGGDLLPDRQIGNVIEIVPGTMLAEIVNNGNAKIILADDYSEHASEDQAERKRYEDGLRSVLAAPIVWESRTIGVAVFRSAHPTAYGDHELEIAAQICAQISGTIASAQQFRLLESVLEDVQTQAMALEAADDAIIIRNEDTSVMYVNSGFERQTGFKKEEVVGTHFNYPENSDSTPQSLVDLYEYVRNGNTWRKTVRSIRKDGSEYTVDATLSPVFNKAGDFDKYVGVRRDVTERVLADEANQTLATALEDAEDAVVILGTDTSTLWVNEAFVRNTGYSREEAIGKRSPFLRSESTSPETFDAMWTQVRSGQRWTGRLWTRRKDGSEYLSESSITPVFSTDGEIAKYVSTRRDITSMIQAEQDREVKRDLDAQNEQLVKLNAQREEFFSTVSHELRTPLTSVMAFADILSKDRDNSLTTRQQEHLDVIKRNSSSLNELINDMLDFSRMGNDHLKLDKSEIEIHALLDSVVESMEPTMNLRRQTLAIEPHAEPVWVAADYGRIVQVISNLITNSCKYSSTDTRITLSVNSENDQVAITVADQGIGISSEDLESVFSPFFRSSQPDVRKEIGTGLGLAISKTLVDLHEGTIRADSVIDEGTQITVTLPGASSTPNRSSSDPY